MLPASCRKENTVSVMLAANCRKEIQGVNGLLQSARRVFRPIEPFLKLE
jgi:hypothetical protein